MSQTSLTSKTEILKAFERLLQARDRRPPQVATKEEEAEKEQNAALLERVADYTVDQIVNGTAALQLEFGGAIHDLSERLNNETVKLDELKKAIAVETTHLEQLQQIQIVADALYILRQEHTAQLETLTNRITEQKEAITKDATQTRKLWQKEQAEFETQQTEAEALREQQRTQEQADYAYEMERARKIAHDEYEEQQRQQERDLAEQDASQEKGWVEREQYLEEHAEEFAEHQSQIEGFEEQLKTALDEAKAEAIREADRDAKVKADLQEKSWVAEEQGYQLRITALEATIERQMAQVAELTEQLQAATQQAQSLAMQAFPTTAASA
ncbi:MAG: hypothetical protein F6J87_10465 [Spirulina sp. SIO3F2]|nr:hypothetical protein [Spirulina sp. SIO3F2]